MQHDQTVRVEGMAIRHFGGRSQAAARLYRRTLVEGFAKRSFRQIDGN
jgi:hypothetical protein